MRINLREGNVMLFYKIEATIDTAKALPVPTDRQEYRAFAGTLAEKSESYYCLLYTSGSVAYRSFNFSPCSK